jgi:Flp pilus assembly pilin Flp
MLTFLVPFMTRLNDVVARVRSEEDGQGLAEYALILVFIAIVAIVALTFLGKQISSLLSTVGSSI